MALTVAASAGFPVRPPPATYPRTGLHVQCAVRVLALVPGAGVPSAWTSPPTVSLENAPLMSPQGALPSLPFSGKCSHRDVPVRLRPGRPWLLPHLHCHTLSSATFTSRHMSLGLWPGSLLSLFPARHRTSLSCRTQRDLKM